MNNFRYWLDIAIRIASITSLIIAGFQFTQDDTVSAIYWMTLAIYARLGFNNDPR